MHAIEDEFGCTAQPNSLFGTKETLHGDPAAQGWRWLETLLSLSSTARHDQDAVRNNHGQPVQRLVLLSQCDPAAQAGDGLRPCCHCPAQQGMMRTQCATTMVNQSKDLSSSHSVIQPLRAGDGLRPCCHCPAQQGMMRTQCATTMVNQCKDLFSSHNVLLIGSENSPGWCDKAEP